mmetsp:Transcript_104114/g.184874  ORF Transcript_104114/g.184874 Transcript_104114/m.184874 type:complete len:91 (+) Transcript_104114:1640-1912(+)
MSAEAKTPGNMRQEASDDPVKFNFAVLLTPGPASLARKVKLFLGTSPLLSPRAKFLLERTPAQVANRSRQPAALPRVTMAAETAQGPSSN